VNKLVSQVKVLVVDDQPLIVEEICEFLESNGYRSVPCLSSRQALERFREDSGIGLVLCDLQMPELDGIELVRQLQQIAGKHRAFEAIMRAGIADYYQKPVDLHELLDGIHRQDKALAERNRTDSLGHLNQKLQFLAESIDDLYQDLNRIRRGSPAESSEEADPDSAQLLPEIVSQLSPRQLDVARLVGKGQTNYQIACELGITENTVKLYVSQVLRLTHMHNRTQLALALSPANVRHRGITEH